MCCCCCGCLGVGGYVKGTKGASELEENMFSSRRDHRINCHCLPRLPSLIPGEKKRNIYLSFYRWNVYPHVFGCRGWGFRRAPMIQSCPKRRQVYLHESPAAIALPWEHHAAIAEEARGGLICSQDIAVLRPDAAFFEHLGALQKQIHVQRVKRLVACTRRFDLGVRIQLPLAIAHTEGQQR